MEDASGNFEDVLSDDVDINERNRYGMSTQFVGSLALAFSTTGIISFVGNVMLIFTFCRLARLRKKAANIFTIHLAINNALLGIMALRIGVKMFRYEGAIDILSCQAEGFILSTIHMNVMLTIAAMFGERYVVICLSSSHDSWLSVCHYRPGRVIAFIWIHSAFWAIWPLMTIVPHYLEETLIPCCIFNRHTPSPINILYLVSMSLSAFVLPLMFACFTMNRIFAVVKKSSETVRVRRGRRYVTQTRSVCSGTDLSFEENAPVNIPTKPASLKGEETRAEVPLQVMVTTTETATRLSKSTRTSKTYVPERAVIRSAVVLLTSFAISWTPFLFVCLVNLSGVSISNYVVVISYLTSKASCVHSSYAYATHQHYKATLRYLACKT